MSLAKNTLFLQLTLELEGRKLILPSLNVTPGSALDPSDRGQRTAAPGYPGVEVRGPEQYADRQSL